MGSIVDSDRDYVIADINPKSLYRGRVYVFSQNWSIGLSGSHAPTAATLWRSRDGGATFDPPVQKLVRPPQGIHPWALAVLPNGTFVALLDTYDRDSHSTSQSEKSLLLLTSHDGGDSLDPATVIYKGDVRTGPGLAVDVSDSPFRGRLYATWGDGQFGRPVQIVLSSSSDGGKTWSAPRIVNDDGRPVHEGDLTRNPGLPTIAINNAGVIGVSWLDRRNDVNEDGSYQVRFAASYDGGETFSPSVLVSENPKTWWGPNEKWLVSTMNDESRKVRVESFIDDWDTGGHTMGLDADARGRFHALWVDNRTGIHQIGTAAITAPGLVAVNGAPDRSKLVDISSRVRLVRDGISYDRASQILQMRIRIKNDSPQPINGPILLRSLVLFCNRHLVR